MYIKLLVFPGREIKHLMTANEMSPPTPSLLHWVLPSKPMSLTSKRVLFLSLNCNNAPRAAGI